MMALMMQCLPRHEWCCLQMGTSKARPRQRWQKRAAYVAVVATLTFLPQGQDAAADVKSQHVQDHHNKEEKEAEQWTSTVAAMGVIM